MWEGACVRLLNTLEVLQRGASRSFDVVEKTDAEQTAMMICGFAFENAAKAVFLSRGNPIYNNGKLCEKFRFHTLCQWANDLEIEMSDWQKEALDRVEYFTIAWGRYPFHNKRQKERRCESFGWSDIELIRGVIKRMLSKKEEGR
jgi:hypothetical protein